MYEGVTRAFSAPSLVTYFDKGWPVSAFFVQTYARISSLLPCKWQVVMVMVRKF